MAYGGKLKEFAKVFAGITDFWGNFQPHYVDTIDLGKLTFAGDPEVTSYKLELLAERLGIELDDAHDADADVTATLNVAIVCSNRLRNSDGSSTGAGLQKKEKSRTHFKRMTEENGIVSFKKDERMRYGVLGYDGNEMMAAITGYDLDVSFNMRLINSLADAEACADALADVFYQALMEQLISLKPDIAKEQMAAVASGKEQTDT